MDAKRLEELEALANAATPGPWTIDQNDKDQYADLNTSKHKGNIIWYGFARCFGQKENPILGTEYMMANAALIAASRTAIPELISEVRRLQAENAKLKNDNERLYETADSPYTE